MLDPVAIHRYLTFSFVPSNDDPFGRIHERIDPRFADESLAIAAVDACAREAVRSRLPDGPVGLFLSGGLDSSAVAVWLRELGADVRAFSLDFGDASVERDEAKAVADHLGIPLTWVPCDGDILAPRVLDLARRLRSPFGDAVTGPQLLLNEAARSAGLTAVFNGEGGDQLFGGWTNKPMIAASLFDADNETLETMYLRSYHRFHGLERDLYTAEFLANIGNELDCRPLLAPYLSGDRATTFLGKLRLADLYLKGTGNIIPRMNAIAESCGLALKAPLFDRELTELAFRLPTRMKLRGNVEKVILKELMRGRLPASIVDRQKSGMCVPVTDWLFGPMRSVVDDFLGDATIRRRGLFRPEYVAKLRRGEDEPNETRRRRIGEKLWTLLMLEAWMRVFIDGGGHGP